MTATTPPTRLPGRMIRALVASLCLAVTAQGDEISVADSLLDYDADVRLPVRIADVSAGVVAVELTVAFDPTVLRVDSLAFAGTALDGWLLDTVRTSGPSRDTLRLAAATAADTLAGTGVLFWIDGATADIRHVASTGIELLAPVVNAGTPALTTGTVILAGDDGEVAASATAAFPGQTVDLTVTDADEDRLPGTDTVPLRVTFGSDEEELVLSESSPGRFETTLSLVYATDPVVGDGILQVEPGADATVCYTDSLDATGQSVDRCRDISILGGTNGTVAATTVVQSGDPIYLRVDDVDLNADAGLVESATVALVNLRTGESESVALDETGADTGVFYGSAATADGDGPGTDDDGTLLARRGDDLEARYTDEATLSGSPETRTATTATVQPLGDASGNGSVRGFDASLILDHSVGALTLTGLDSLSANLDDEAPHSPINAFDASLVLQLRVGLRDGFPVQEAGSANHPQPVEPAPRRLPLARPLALEPVADGWVLRIDAQDIVAGDVTLRGFHGQVSAADGFDGLLVATRTSADVTRVVFAAGAPAAQGRLLHLIPASADQYPVVDAAQFNGGRVQGLLSSPASAARLRLHPVSPNPFNPGTVIRFDLPQDAPVRLWIVNALGQSVRVLVDGSLPAGVHGVSWDGRDDAGRPAASGVYFHRLQTPTGGDLGTMTLLR
jgi:hypothetical protein